MLQFNRNDNGNDIVMLHEKIYSFRRPTFANNTRTMIEETLTASQSTIEKDTSDVQ